MKISFHPAEYLIGVVRKTELQKAVESDFLLRAIRVRNSSEKAGHILEYSFDLRSEGMHAYAFAVLYMTRDVDVTGGVSVVGSIEVYDDDGVTELTSYDFPNFTGGEAATAVKHFFINNTGNQPVYVYWNISSSSVNWVAGSLGYGGYEAATHKYNYYIATSWLPDPLDYWAPNDYTTPEALYPGVGEGKELQIRHQYTGDPNTAESYSLVMSFYAEDA